MCNVTHCLEQLPSSVPDIEYKEDMSLVTNIYPPRLNVLLFSIFSGDYNILGQTPNGSIPSVVFARKKQRHK